jgi:two-component system, chemotaxis family, protein-glutamate methylesterase/glutaminase
VEAAVDRHARHVAIQRDLVVIGASAGGVESLRELVAGLPSEFPAALLIVLHVPSTGTSVLPQILSRRAPLPAKFACDEETLERGQIYVAPADHHMLIHDGRIRLTQGPRENGHRPAIDPLFRSAARAAGARCIGVVMSGLLDDGATGLRFIHDHGGVAVVQDPEDAQFPSMPRAALALTDTRYVVPAAAMGETLCTFVDEALAPEALERPAFSGALPLDEDIDDLDRVELSDPSETRALLAGPPSALTCPECGGSLWEQDNGRAVRFACHVGHAYTLATLLEEQGRQLEGALWSAVRSLEERADVHRRLARRTAGPRSATYVDRAKDAEAHARSLRDVLAVAGRLAAPVPEDA